MAAPVLRPLSRGLDPERFFSDKGVVVNKVLAGAARELAAFLRRWYECGERFER